MQRETITVTLPVTKKVVILNKYLLGRDRRALTNVYIDNGLSVDQAGKIGQLNSKIVDAAQDLAWKLVVVSIDGKTDNVINDILDLGVEDYDFIVEEVNKITSNKAVSEKKTT